MTDLPDVDSSDAQTLADALQRVGRQYRTAPHEVRRGLPDTVPADVAAWWLAAWNRYMELTEPGAQPKGPLYVGTVEEPMPLRKVRLRKPGPTR